MSQTYRWNVADHAAGYDSSAEVIHPHYVAIQDAILREIDRQADAEFLLVDLGGGSGRLAEQFLQKFSRARAVVIDQSEAFLQIAVTRMARFAGRGTCLTARLQEDWTGQLPSQPTVITSMSAIHHLDSQEKQQLYQRAYDVLVPDGVLLNGDEIRAADDREYRDAVATWAAHMRQVVAEGRFHEAMHPMLEKWELRNVTNFGLPRTSGDDCHETIAAQLGYFRNCGFRRVGVSWQQQMWAVMQGVK